MRLTYKAQDQHGKETGTVWYTITAGGSIFPKSDKEEQVLKKLAAYEDAEEQDRLVRLPCRVGDTVYFLQRCLDSYTFVNCGDIIAFHVYSSYVTVEVNDRDASHPFVTLDVSAFGKTVFLTHEEAEVALKGG